MQTHFQYAMKRLGLLFCLCSTVWVAACGFLPTPTTPTDPTTTTSAVIYSAIGASDASGVGSSSPCLPYVNCPDGMGYVQVLARRYTSDGKTVTLQNLGVPGAALSKTFQDIGNQVNRGILINFVTDEMPFVKTDATLVTVFAGGNDANAVASAAKAGLYGADPTSWIATQIQTFGKDMTTLIAGIKARAPKAKIVILNLPNLAAMPYMAGSSAADKKVMQSIAVGMNTQINLMASQGAVVVDLMCDSRVYSPSIFSSDGFHPNDTGYALFTDLIYAAVAAASPATPKSACSAMSTF